MHKSLMKMFSATVLSLLLMTSNNAIAANPETEDLQRMQQFMSVMQGYFSIIEETYNVASSPEKSAILQLQKIEEIYKQRGDAAESIKVLREVVSNTKSDIVRNAASIMLADALSESGRASEAIKVLRTALDKNLR